MTTHQITDLNNNNTLYTSETNTMNQKTPVIKLGEIRLKTKGYRL